MIKGEYQAQNLKDTTPPAGGSGSPFRILVADDHQVVRRGLKDLLAECLGEVAVGEARDCEETLRKVKLETWDLVLLDLNMPGKGGFEALAELKQMQPQTPILVLSVSPEAEFAVRALQAGAAGYINKQFACDELMAAVKKALAGGKYVSAMLAEKMATGLEKGIPVARHERLSKREFEILRFIALGKTAKEIAGELSLSVKTVGTYRTRILKKTGLSTNVEITRYALQNRLVE